MSDNAEAVTPEDTIEKLSALFEDEDFQEELMSAIKDKDSVKTLFTNNGVEISDEEADAAVAKFKACEAGGELDESELENVAGGGSNPVINFIEKAWLCSQRDITRHNRKRSAIH